MVRPTRKQLVTGVKHVAGWLLLRLRLHRFALSNSALVVTFHRVNDNTIGDGLTCSLAMFEKYCRLFAEHFRVVPLRKLVARLESGIPPTRQLALTFDDGYLDNYECAAPICPFVSRG